LGGVLGRVGWSALRERRSTLGAAILLFVCRSGWAATLEPLHPVADTYVQAGSQTTWTHGAGPRLRVSGGPARVAYLRFDLRGLANAIDRATLELSVLHSAADGGTVYRVLDTNWVEGQLRAAPARASAQAGLTWALVDSNRDGALDMGDISGLVPARGIMIGALGPVRRRQTIVVDVTRALAGPGFYTFGLASARHGAAAYASREYQGGAHAAVLNITTRDGVPPPPGPEPDPGPGPGPGPQPAPPAPAFSCLGQTGPLITLTGTHTTHFSDISLKPNSRIDARAATFLASPTNLYPLIPRGGPGVCFAGGFVKGQYDRSASWQAMHDVNNAGVAVQGDNFTVDGVRVDNVEDGIRPEKGHFVIRQAWLSYIRDDCVENDHVQGGLIDDSFFDGCYVGVSERPTPSIVASGSDGRGEVLTVRRSLIRLQPMPGPRGNKTRLGNGHFFKWSNYATAVVLEDNVFMAEQVSADGAGSMVMPPHMQGCARNVMVWLGPGNYPAPLPSCFTVTKDRGVWDAAAAAWKASHPAIGVVP
jgi:hypothetical protein